MSTLKSCVAASVAVLLLACGRVAAAEPPTTAPSTRPAPVLAGKSVGSGRADGERALLPLALIIPIVTGAGGLVLSLFVFLHSRQQRADTWVQQFSLIHDSFWKDPDMAEVRAWIANDEAFEKARHVLSKRREGRQLVPAAEYELLDHLDKFLNLLVRAEHIPRDLRRVTRLRERLFHNYWVSEIVAAGKAGSLRADLFWYATEFYPELFENHK